MKPAAIRSGLSGVSAKVSLLTVGATLVTAAAGLIVFQFISVRESVINDLTVQARLIAESSNAAILFRDERAGREILNSLRASPSIEAAAAFDHDKKMLAEYNRTDKVDVLHPSASLVKEGYLFKQRYIDVAQSVFSNNQRIGTIVVRADLYEMYKRLAMSISVTLLIILGSVVVAYLLVSRMRGALVAAENHLTHLAHTDSITGLPNRHAFSERLDYAIAKTKRFGGSVELLLLDLDNFKFVNDTLGHHSGDQLLSHVAQRLTEALRNMDLICRIGGDEFAIILESASQSEQARTVADKVIRALSSSFHIGQNEIYVSCSIGISRCPQDGDSLRELARNADTAMYQAKKQGKNTFIVFSPEMDQSSRRRLLIETRLRHALEQGELSLHYQPKLRLKDSRITGFEALLRWHDSQIGSMSPAEFVPIAEECGLMLPIGAWVIRTACRDMAAWRDQGLGDIRVAVNLSARQTKDKQLLEAILAALAEHRIDPSKLELEITESTLMEHIESNIVLLEKIRACGIRLSLDDFGTGYSSLAYLKRFKIDEVKIDRAFIKDIPDDEEDMAIVTSIVALADSLGLTAVAEGVENEKQYSFLRSIHCDSIQGYYIAPALPYEEVLTFLQRQEQQQAKNS